MSTEVVLLSGGVESATLLAQAVERGDTVIPLFVDYGQRAGEQERRAARAQCQRHGLSLSELDMAAVGQAFRQRQTQKRHVPTPHRNLIILSLALAFAEQEGAEGVALALIKDDAGYYPSAGPDFLEAFAGTAATLGSVAVHAPLQDRSKAEVIALGVDSGVDFTTTYSCLLGYERHCGVCPQCRKRRAAFAAAGVAEPEGFYRED